MAWVAGASNSAAGNEVTIGRPDGLADGHILAAIVAGWSGSDFPSEAALEEWTLWYTEGLHPDTGNYATCSLLWKPAASESADYTFVSTGAAETYGIVAALSGRLASGDPLDVGSNTSYITNNTTVRAAGVTIATAGSDLLYFGYTVPSATPTLSTPGGMSTGVSADFAPFWTAFECAYLENQAAGATGDKDGTAAATTTWKHAFLVALKPDIVTPVLHNLMMMKCGTA